MTKPATTNATARLLKPANAAGSARWSFLVLPRELSATLPRRGRTSVRGTLNGAEFTATLEPDGQRSHWLKVSPELREAAGCADGDEVEIAIEPLKPEPEPELPADLGAALADAPSARATWDATTTLARVDWIHWLDTAKQDATRNKRIAAACDMLAHGKKRVCCFDSSGYYDHSQSAPESAI